MAQTEMARLDELFSEAAKRVAPGAPQGRGLSPDRVNFAGGAPDPKSMPTKEIAAATARAMEKNGQWALQYGGSAGYTGLIEQLLIKLKRDNGVDVRPENVLITAGASQAIDLVCDALVDPGDVILSEEPTFLGALRLFNAHRAKVVGIPMDDQGMKMDALADKLAELKTQGVRPKFIYVIPTFQNPTGITTTLERRLRILELAKEYNVAVLEDDAYYDLRFSGERLPMMIALDDAGLVIYTGTFSKIIGAGLRLGWIIAPEPFIHKVAKLKPDGGTSPFTSHVVAEYAPSQLEGHVKELVNVYRSRRDAMIGALKSEMPEGVEWTEPEGGFFVWLTLPEGMDAVAIQPEAAAHGVDYMPGTVFFPDQQGRRNIRLAYSFTDEETIQRGVKTLAGILREYAPAK
ncbi:MAG: PLP-dependent aminotransferase family protein [Chloroflexota bacterium]|nr:PLP-dependent aminotransferase family protein [Chloroflexota bacterium]MDQ6906003.1 PLP-dependent aminotransferase family protein [Chloroflexota bacterium]